MKKETRINNILYLVIPCYNEEEVLEDTNKVLIAKMNKLIAENLISNESKIMYVNDGSKDNTWKLIKEFNNKNNLCVGINLSGNRGHQVSVTAGMLIAKEKERADMVITMDADLQDDIDAIDKMVKKYIDGADVVFGVRKKRTTDTFFKRFTAETFYKLMEKMGAKTIYNHADFRLMSKRVLNEFEKYSETNLYLRGIFPLIGFNQEKVYYDRKEREKGESKYTLSKMVGLAWDGINSFSLKPIHYIGKFSITLSIISILCILWMIIDYLINAKLHKIFFLSSFMMLLASVVLFAIFIVGEYIGKIYTEVKNRPRYHIMEDLENNTYNKKEGEIDERKK